MPLMLERLNLIQIIRVYHTIIDSFPSDFTFSVSLYRFVLVFLPKNPTANRKGGPSKGLYGDYILNLRLGFRLV